MNCQLIREAMSAAMDGEPSSVPVELVNHHLVGCARCREWRSAAEAVSRQARVTPASDLDGLADRIIEAIEAQDRPGRREWALTRGGLCLVAVLQLAIAIPILILGHDREAPLHVTHEMGSWDAALAIGLLLAARRPSRAEGMSVLVGVVAALLCVTAVVDLVAGRTSVTDEAPHLLCVVGWLLLHRLSVLNSIRSPGSTPGAVRPADTDAHRGSTSGSEVSDRALRAAPDISAQAGRPTDLTA